MRRNNAKILARLRRGPLTALQALRELGQMRLAARIHELRAEGVSVKSTMVKRGRSRVAVYSL